MTFRFVMLAETMTMKLVVIGKNGLAKLCRLYRVTTYDPFNAGHGNPPEEYMAIRRMGLTRKHG
jgi:hypothetical protein